MKIFSKAAALTLAATMALGIFAGMRVEADAKEKIKTVKKADSTKKNNKLVNKKTGKVIKGYVTYDGKLYKDGVIFKGTVNGITYSAGKKATGIASDGLLYVNGEANEGDYVYKDVWYKGTTTDVEKNEEIASYKKVIAELKEVDFTTENWTALQKMLAENTLDLTGKPLSLEQLKTALQTIHTTKEQVV